MALYDWQGNSLDMNQTPEWDGMTGRSLFWDDLVRVYDAQQILKN